MNKLFALFGAPTRSSGQISLRRRHEAIRLEASKKGTFLSCTSRRQGMTYWVRKTLIPGRQCYYK